MSKRGILALVTAALLIAGAVNAAEETRLMRFPDIYGDKIIFTYGRDLWIVPSDGGTARQLTSHMNSESIGKFSPDGSTIAFSASYDGNMDIYTIPVGGGVPKRLTYHLFADFIVDWHPSGKKVLFRSARESKTNPGPRYNRLFLVPVDGGYPEALPLFEGELTSYSPDGKKIAYNRMSREFRTWKRYRGGMAQNIWLYDLEKNTSELLTDFDGTDAFPMWYENRIYFISDREHAMNIYCLDLDTRKVRQVTDHDEFDVKWPSLGGDKIVYENGGQLYVLDLSTEKSRKITVAVPAELKERRSRYEHVAGMIRGGSLSAAGKRAVMGARGDIFTLPAEKGDVRNITKTSGVRERLPDFSPNGKWVAYVSDQTGEYEIYLRKPDGSGDEEKVTTGLHGYPFGLLWSPDSKKLLVYDQTFSLYYVDIEEKRLEKIDEDDYGDMNDFSWSKDASWIAYSKNQDNGNSSIYLYSVADGKSHKVTSDLYNDYNPVFDPAGKYLYFCTNRMANFQFNNKEFEINYVYPTNIVVATLRKDVPSLLAPESDEVEVKEDEEKKDEDKKDEGDKKEENDKKKDEGEKKEDEKDKSLEIDIEGLEGRIIGLPVGTGSYFGLMALEDKVIYADIPKVTVTTSGGGANGFTLSYFDLKKRETQMVIAGINGFDVSDDGKKVLYGAQGTFGIIDLAPGKKISDGRIAVQDMTSKIDPLAEWTQIFNEAWRFERDFFYVDNMHGVDWKKMKKRYEAFLPYMASRSDLNYIIGEMIAELSVGHSYVGGGDYMGGGGVGGASLGCDFEVDQKSDRFKISKIYAGRNWDPQFRSPLNQPGIEVEEGDYLLAINGIELEYPTNPYALLETLADKQTVIKVSKNPKGDDAKEFTVVPVSSDINLRYDDWVEGNRRKVAEASGGRIGYVHVPNTNVWGLAEFGKYFYGQTNLDGLIIDDRYNSGGWMPNLFVDRLAKKVTGMWAQRYGKLGHFPGTAPLGHMAMVINEYAGSGGDAFPYLFKQAGLGPLIGMRTWGGLVGMNRNIPLMDGGYCTVPTIGFIDVDKGDWAVENYGVDPDIEVQNMPHENVKGRDQQLEAAIDYLMKKIEEDPPKLPGRPKSPDKY